MYKAGEFLEPMVEDRHNKDLITSLCMYFAKDPAFNSLPYGGDNPLVKAPNLKKGILLSGVPGTGKTSTMRVFQKINRRTPGSFAFASCKDIEGQVRAHLKNNKDPLQILDMYGGKKDIYSNSEKVIKGCLFDDFGEETRIHRFNKGDVIDVMDFILQARYQNYGFKVPTYMTTNLSPRQIKEGYSARVVDRIRQYFNQIAVTGGSWRAAHASGKNTRD